MTGEKGFAAIGKVMIGRFLPSYWITLNVFTLTSPTRNVMCDSCTATCTITTSCSIPIATGLAIDPKGVLGELEYEVGAALRNPCENPGLFASPARIETRIARFEAELKLDPDRMLAWGFAQAILSAIWTVEDGSAIDSENAGIRLANAIHPMLTQSWSY